MDLPSKVEIKIHYHPTLSCNCAKIQCVQWQYKENAWPDQIEWGLDQKIFSKNLTKMEQLEILDVSRTSWRLSEDSLTFRACIDS